MKIQSSKFKIQNFWKDRFNIITLATSLLINLIIWLILFFKIQPQNQPIVLHYNIYFGIDFIDQWYKIYFIPSLGLLFILLNLIISFVVYREERLLVYFLLSASLFIQILLVIASFCIVLAQ